MRPATKKANPFGLRSNCSNDALDYARHTVNESTKVLMGDNWNVAKSYSEGAVELELNLSVKTRSTKYNLIVRSIPLQGERRLNSPTDHMATSKIHCNRCESMMLCLFGKLTNGPQDVIPSLVWLESPKKITNGRREVWTTARYSTAKVLLNITEWKVNFGELDAAVGNGNFLCDCIDGKIKRRSEILDSICCDINKGQRKYFPSCLEFMNFVNSIRIRLDNMSVWITQNESVKSPFKLTTVKLRTSQSSL